MRANDYLINPTKKIIERTNNIPNMAVP